MLKDFFLVSVWDLTEPYHFLDRIRGGEERLVIAADVSGHVGAGNRSDEEELGRMIRRNAG